MKKVLDFVIRSNEKLNHQNNLLKVSPKNGQKLDDIYPGQFVQILVDNSSSVFLRRPISINFVDRARNEMWLLVQNMGKGSQKICEKHENEVLNIIFPLGNTFTIPEDRSAKLLLVGGGVGTAPMHFLGKTLIQQGYIPNFLLGGRSKTDILQTEDFKEMGNTYFTTEDGSLGEKGFVTHHSILKESKFDYIYTCGPKPMMIAISKLAKEMGAECEASLENYMPCGFGACLCCVEKTSRGNIATCMEGPIFNTRELLWTS